MVKNELNSHPIKKFFTKVFSNITKKIPDSIKEGFNLGKEEIHATQAQSVAEGKNAFYYFRSKVSIAGEKVSGLIFHEIGHALNATKPIGKLLQNYGRRLPIIAGLLGTFALLTTSKKTTENSDEKLTGWQKTKNFIDKNIGLITLGSFLPTILEEGMATSKGLKHASKHFNNIKPFKKLYGIGMASYLALVGLTSLGITLANKAQNKIVEKRTQKVNS